MKSLTSLAFVSVIRGFVLRAFVAVTALGFAGVLAASPAHAKTITIVGTPHLAGLNVEPTAEQIDHTIAALSAFGPTQVCVERMSGERIEAMLADPADRGATLRQPELSSRRFAVTVPIGTRMQMQLGLRPGEAREQAKNLARSWNRTENDELLWLVALQLAGFEFHSAVLNWSYLLPAERSEAHSVLSPETIAELDAALSSRSEVYALAVPLARKAGLHELCTADSLADETSGMAAAKAHGGKEILSGAATKAQLDDLMRELGTKWQPDNGAAALTSMLRYYNGEGYAEIDRRLQWDGLLAIDNDTGAFYRRMMFWHSRTFEISAELMRALGRGPNERVLLIIGSAHRAFTEASLRSQPWIDVLPASSLLEPDVPTGDD